MNRILRFIKYNAGIKINRKINACKEKRLRKKVLKVYDGSDDEEIKNCLECMRRSRSLNVFNFDGMEYYATMDIQVYTYEGMPYVIRNGKRLFFPAEYSEAKVVRAYCQLALEQDPRSPHRYLSQWSEAKDYVVFDCGAAEGIFSLDIIDYAKHIYLFECDEKWIRPLELTFEPWKQKVSIIKKYVTDSVNEHEITIDECLKDLGREVCKKILVKMDIEGGEKLALEGMRRCLEQEKYGLLLCVCTYHNVDDEHIIRDFFDQRFHIESVPGYMLMGKKWPYFRRGVLRITK